MREEELGPDVRCVVCGRDVDPDNDVVYVYGPGDVMCFDCAIARGGAYDELEDRWTMEPSTEGLPDERRSEAW